MSQFHNPYHFVPTDAPPPATVPVSEFALSKKGAPAPARLHPHLTHDRFVAGTHSGRITCKVKVETPLICANEQVGNDKGEPRYGWTKLLKPFILEKDKDEPALPGSGLRGMISAIAEAASGSALRVLSDTALSHRMAVAKESLSAIGLLVNGVNSAGEPVLALQPLTVPTVDRNPPRGMELSSDEFPAEFFGFFQPSFGQPLLKAYVDGYRKRGQSEVEVTSRSFLDRLTPDSQSADHSEFWYARLCGTVSLAGTAVSATAEIRDSPRGRNPGRRFLLAQQLAAEPISQTVYDALPAADQSLYTRGFLRVLGIKDRESEIPTTKKHEYFIPYPVTCEKTIPRFDVTPAVERFHRLADQRTDTDAALPFAVKGSRRNANPGPGNPKLRLRAGDLVYFKPNDDGTDIAEVTVSSIWRAGNGSVHEYFAGIAPELLPLTPDRHSLTLADQLLGAVEIRDSKQEKQLNNQSAFALASRLRVCHARLLAAPEGEGPWQDADELLSPAQLDAKRTLRLTDIPLQNLASPKPPSPSLYFKPMDGNGGYVPKATLAPTSHRPQGRKFYMRRDPDSYKASESAFVHHGRLGAPDDRASIGRMHQSVERFVRPWTSFCFTVDFDNLTELELGLLLYSLEPSAAFRHQLGHGKPLGLGQIHLVVSAIELVDRRKRYAEDALAGSSRWHTRHVREESLAPETESGFGKALEELTKPFRQWADRNGLGSVLHALELVGTPVADGTAVHYPQAFEVNRGTGQNPDWRGVEPGTAAFQNEHYHWFTQNDDTTGARIPGQYLAPLINGRGQAAASLPKLDRRQLDRRQIDGLPRTSYAGPVAGGGPQGGGAAPRTLHGGGQAGGGAPTTHVNLAGHPAQALVIRHHTKKGKTTIRFQVECAGLTFTGTLAQPNVNRDRTDYPENSEKVYDFILLNPRRDGAEWHCQRKKPDL